MVGDRFRPQRVRPERGSVFGLPPFNPSQEQVHLRKGVCKLTLCSILANMDFRSLSNSPFFVKVCNKLSIAARCPEVIGKSVDFSFFLTNGPSSKEGATDKPWPFLLFTVATGAIVKWNF